MPAIGAPTQLMVSLGEPQAWLLYLPAPSSTTPAEETAGRPGDAYGGQYPAVEAPPASYPPGQQEKDGHYGHERVGTRRSRKQEAGVHEHAEEGGYTGKGPEDEGDSDQGLSKDHQVAKDRRMRDHDVSEERGTRRIIEEAGAL